MAVAQNVFKRGSVYWWRRRLPDGTSSRALVLVEVSLRTKHVEQAKFSAARLTLISEQLFRELRAMMIKPDDVKRILIEVAKTCTTVLDSHSALELSHEDNFEKLRMRDVAEGWVARILSSQGRHAAVGHSETQHMRAAGLDETAIKSVSDMLDTYRLLGLDIAPRPVINALMQKFEIPESERNFDQVQQIYFRGIAAAHLHNAQRRVGIRQDDDALLQAALLTDSLPESSRVQPIHKASLGVRDDGDFDLDDEIDVEDDTDDNTRGLIEIVERAAAQNVKSGDWGDKTAKQHIALAKIFVRYVGHDNPAKMKQSHISDFKIMLSEMPKNYGKSPQDHVLPLVDILARAKEMPPEQVGLSQSTLNRHMTQLGNIAAICKHAGFPFGNFEGVSGLRSKKKGSGRGERARFSTDELRLLFNLSIWNGCESEDARLSPGEVTFHDASYWVPMLALYHGPRREEYCGLLISEVEPEAEIPAIRIEPNFVRGLKNPESKRRIPIHPELIRLGFLEYVAALQGIGHVLLFPELKAAAASTPMGDVFDQSWQDMRITAIPSSKDDGKVLHSFRHWCNNEMKQAGVAAEIRKDILGHTNADTNEGRYSDAARLRLMAEALAQLPQPTAHVTPFPIRLIKRVEKHLAPPTKARKVAS
ncbi:DUF6538 domain-containing protein [Agrobacterium sp. 22-211-1]|uniref:DUF6538 domain-containing protein n=1 Tax=Agrobacterium tomkonis TaxID=1183410 RepID=UPI001CD9F470|nr:site-specific integrase [Agrobacterium tomkonis RTP8]